MGVSLDKSSLSNAKLMLYGVKNGFPKAFCRALTNTAKNTRTEMIRLVRRDYSHKASAIRKRIKVDKATYSKLSASVESTGRSFHLTDIAGTRETNKGVSVNVKKSTGVKLIPRAFENKSGKKAMVLRRAGKPRGQHEKLYRRYGPPGSGGKAGSRARIDTFYAPHPEVLYNTDENWSKIQKIADGKMATNFAHEVDVVLKGIA